MTAQKLSVLKEKIAQELLADLLSSNIHQETINI